MLRAERLRRALAGCAAGALLLACAPAAGAQEDAVTRRELGSNRYTQALTESEPLAGHDLEGFEPLLENDVLAVYFRSRTGAIRVRDKRSGYVWGMMAQDQPENLNSRWAAIANSLVMVEAFDAEDKEGFGGVQQLACTVDGATARFEARLPDWQLSFAFTMTLEGDALTFAMSDESIREEGDWRLASVTFAPFFGAAEGDSIPGYVFVPDGCGALMRFMTPRNYLQGYEKRIWGADAAIDPVNSAYAGEGNAALEEQTASLPVFGVTHGERQNAFLAVVQRGEEYGSIVAEPAGLVCDYTRANVKFTYRQMYEQPISRVGVGIQTVQAQPNRVDPQITYYFLTGEDAGYAGMARRYRALLEQDGVLTRREMSRAVPLRVDFLAADLQKEFIGTSVRQATSLEAIGEFSRRMTGEGVELSVGLVGWQDGGLHGYDKTESAGKTVYGGLEELADLAGEVDLALMLDPVTAKEGQFSAQQEGGITLSQNLITLQGEEDAWLGDTYYLKPAAALEALEEQTDRLAQAGLDRFVLDGIGSALYGEYLSGQETTRAQARAAVEEAAAGLAGQYGPLTVTRPNSYLFGYLGSYDQVPMSSSQFLYETDTVPFLQMVLSGYVELYAPYGNLSFYSALDRLKMIDFNTYPTYLLTEIDNYSLRKTASADLSSTALEDWEADVLESWRQVSGILSQVRGQALVDRRTPQAGLVENRYEDGVVYINYNTVDCVASDGTRVPGQSALYREGGANG